MKTLRLMLESDLSLRKALAYSGSSRQLYYYKPRERSVRLDGSIVNRVKEVALERPSFGTRRMAAILTRELGYPVNRKKIQRIFRALNWTSPAMKKSEIIRSSVKLLKPLAPNTLWEADMTYIWCGRDRWCYLFSVLDVFTRIWVGYAFDTRAGRENAIMSVNNSLAARPEIDLKNLTLRVDNGSQVQKQGVHRLDEGSRDQTGIHIRKHSRAKWSHRIVPEDNQKRVHLGKRFQGLPGS